MRFWWWRLGGRLGLGYTTMDVKYVVYGVR